MKKTYDTFLIVTGLFLITLAFSIILFDASILINLIAIPLSIFGWEVMTRLSQRTGSDDGGKKQ